MEDLYQYLISGAPKQGELDAIVQQLRRQRSLGELGSLSGDRVLQPFGQGQMRGADDYAEQLQGIRQKDIDNAQTAKYQDAQIDYQQDLIADRKEQRDVQRARDAAQAKYWERMADAANKRAEAQLQAALRRGSNKPLTMQGINALNDKRQTRDKITNLKTSFKPEYARKMIPGARTLTNTMSRVAPILISKEDRDAAEWWRQFQLDYNILARNEQFGATLSPNEKLSWAQANAGAEMTDEQITTILNSMERWYNKDLTDLANTMSGTFDPAQVAGAAGQEYAPPPVAGLTPSDEDFQDFWDIYDTDPNQALNLWKQNFPDIDSPDSYSPAAGVNPNGTP